MAAGNIRATGQLSKCRGITGTASSKKIVTPALLTTYSFAKGRRKSRISLQDRSCRGDQLTGAGDRKRNIARSSVAVGHRLEPDAADASDELIEVLQQIYLIFLTCLSAWHYVSSHGPTKYIWSRAFYVRWLCRFRFNRTAISSHAESVFENGKQAEPAREPVVSALCPVGKAGRSPPPSINSDPCG